MLVVVWNVTKLTLVIIVAVQSIAMVGVIALQTNVTKLALMAMRGVVMNVVVNAGIADGQLPVRILFVELLGIESILVRI